MEKKKIPKGNKPLNPRRKVFNLHDSKCYNTTRKNSIAVAVLIKSWRLNPFNPSWLPLTTVPHQIVKNYKWENKKLRDEQQELQKKGRNY
jgi:hypothetical protein